MSFRKEALWLMVTQNLSVFCFPGLKVKRWWYRSNNHWSLPWHNLFLFHSSGKEKEVVPVFHWHSPHVYAEDSSLSCPEKSGLCTLWKVPEVLAPLCSILSADTSGIRAETEPIFSSTLVPQTGRSRESGELFVSVGWALGRLCCLSCQCCWILFPVTQRLLWGIDWDMELGNGSGKPLVISAWRSCFVDADLSSCQILLGGILSHFFL